MTKKRTLPVLIGLLLCAAVGYAQISYTGPVEPTPPAGSPEWSTTNTVAIGSGDGESVSGATLTLANGASWSHSGDFKLAGSSALYVQSGSLFNLEANMATLGSTMGETARVVVDTGAVVNNTSGKIYLGSNNNGVDGLGTSATLTVDGATFNQTVKTGTIRNYFWIGDGNNGLVSILNNGQFNLGGTANTEAYLYIGGNQNKNPDALGTLEISTGGSFNAKTGSWIEVGHDAEGIVNINNGGTWNFEAGRCDIGTYGNGTVNINDGGLLKSERGYVYLGVGDARAHGVVNVNKGGVWDSEQNVLIGVYAGGSGIVNVSGQWNHDYYGLSSSASMTVGREGAGTVNVKSGGVWETSGGYINIGSAANGNGQINVENGGIWNSNAKLVSGVGVANIAVASGGTWAHSADLEVKGTLGISVAKDAKVTVGTADNVVTGATAAVINKTGAGALNVNASMQQYAGTLNVNAGTANLTNGLGATKINVAKGSTLSLQINGADVLGGSSLALTNAGTIALVAKKDLNAGGYRVAASEVALTGTVLAYGGTYSGNTFTAGALERKIAGDFETTVTVSGNDRVLVSGGETAGDEAVFMAFEVAEGERFVVNSVKASSEASVSDLDITIKKASPTAEIVTAWSFGVDYTQAENSRVMLSFIVGAGYDVDMLSIWHRSTGEDWKLYSADDLWYDGESIGFSVNSFSEYAASFSTVPEPAMMASMIGLLALVAVSRRRK